MALLKAFVCQAVLFGLYKLFLEQVVVDHLVPEELTRNCLVGLVILFCFGIQLYTDKAEDDETEPEEDPKAKSIGKATDGKKIESSEIPVKYETVKNVTGSKVEDISTENKHSSTNRKVSDSKDTISVQLPNSIEIDKISHLGISAEFSKNVPDKIEVAASVAETSMEQKPNTFPALNGISDVNVSEESDEECIQIDQFVSKVPSKESEHLMTVEPKKVKNFNTESKLEALPPKQLEEPEQLITDEDKEVQVFKPKLGEEPEKLIIVEDKEAEAFNPEQAKEAVTKYEYLTAKDVDSSSTQDLDSNPMSESEKLMTVDTEEVRPHKPEHVTKNANESRNSMMSNGVINTSQDSNSTCESQQEMKIELNATNSDQLTGDVVQSEDLISNEVNSLSEMELSLDPVIHESDSKIADNSLNNIADAQLDPRNEAEMNSIKEANENGDDGETSTDASQLDEHAKNLSKSSQYVQEINFKSGEVPKVANKSQSIDKYSVEKSAAVNTKLPLPKKVSASEGAYVTYFPIDITFIYACHKH